MQIVTQIDADSEANSDADSDANNNTDSDEDSANTYSNFCKFSNCEFCKNV